MFTENSVSPFYALDSLCEKQRNLKAQPSNLSLCFSLKVSQKQTTAKNLPSWLQSPKPNLKSYAVAMKWKPLVCPSNNAVTWQESSLKQGVLLHTTHWTRFKGLLSARPLPLFCLQWGRNWVQDVIVSLGLGGELDTQGVAVGLFIGELTK